MPLKEVIHRITAADTKMACGIPFCQKKVGET